MYTISKKSYRNAQRVLNCESWSRYSAKVHRDAERIVENYDQGATFDRKQVEFNPQPVTAASLRRSDEAFGRKLFKLL